MSPLSGSWSTSPTQVSLWDASAATQLPTHYLVESESFVHEQTTPSTVWTPITHNLGHYPASAQVYDLALAQQYDEFEVQHLSVNQLRISMDIPTAGIAIVG